MLRIGLLFGPTCCYLVGRIMCFFIAEVFQSQCSTRSDLDISKFAKFVPVGTHCVEDSARPKMQHHLKTPGATGGEFVKVMLPMTIRRFSCRNPV